MRHKKIPREGKLKKGLDIALYAEEDVDRSIFLESFEKPTQIYRYLRNRNAYAPLFLHRNLYFMKHRCRRHKSDIQKRKNFQIDNMLSSVEIKTPIAPSCVRYKTADINVSFLSFLNNGVSGPISDVDIEVFLVKILYKKKKESSPPLVRTSLGKTTVPVNPTCDPHPRSTIVIPHSLFTPSNGYCVQSFRLLIQASGQQKVATLNGAMVDNAIETGEPTCKRRRSNRGQIVTSDTTDTTDTLIYSAELTVYDRYKQCDLTAGQYELTLHDPNQSATKTVPQWYSDPDIVDEASSRFQEFYSSPRLKFDLTWSSVTPDPTISSPTILNDKTPRSPTKSATSRMTVPELMCHSPKHLRTTVPHPRLRIIYQFLYKNNTLQQTEARTDTTCPWCSIQCGRLYALLKHLRLSHARFNFIYVPHAKGAKIEVSVNDRYDGSYVGNPQDLHSHIGFAFSRRGPVRRTPVTHIIVYRPRRGGESLSEFVEGGLESSVTREIVQGHNRLYYSSKTNQPVKPQDLDYDSESENDPLWLRMKTVKMIDEFTDVNEGEKEVMKMWNLHIMKHNFVGDCQLPLACSTFIQQYGADIIAKKLQRNFIIHLVNLFDYSLIKPQTVRKSIKQLRHLTSGDIESGSNSS